MARPTDQQIVESLNLALASLWRHFTVLDDASRLHPAIHDILSDVKKPDAISILERLRYAIRED